MCSAILTLKITLYSPSQRERREIVITRSDGTQAPDMYSVESGARSRRRNTTKACTRVLEKCVGQSATNTSIRFLQTFEILYSFRFPEPFQRVRTGMTGLPKRPARASGARPRRSIVAEGSRRPDPAVIGVGCG